MVSKETLLYGSKIDSSNKNDPLDVSIIIVSYNTKELLSVCLTSLIASENWKVDGTVLRGDNKRLTAEAIVVDNASLDGSPSFVQERFAWVRLIANQQNVGFAPANNQGIDLASGRYIFLLNPDTETAEGAISSAVEFMDEHPEAGVLGFQLLNPNGSLQPSGRDLPSMQTVWRDLLPVPAKLRWATRSRTERRDYSQVCEVGEVSGAAMLLRRGALEQAGLLDQDFFFLGEDVDLCWRLWEHGWKVFYFPSAQIVHHGGGSRAKSSSERTSLLAQRSIYLLIKKHRGRFWARAVKTSLVPITVLKVSKWITWPLAKGDAAAIRQKLSLFVEEMLWLRRNG